MLKKILFIIICLCATNTHANYYYITNPNAYGCYKQDLKECFRLEEGYSIYLASELGELLDSDIVKVSSLFSGPSFKSDWWIEVRFLVENDDFVLVPTSDIAIESLKFDSGDGIYHLLNEGPVARYIQYGGSPQKEYKDEVVFYKHNNVYAMELKKLQGRGVALVYLDQGGCIQEQMCVPYERCELKLKHSYKACPPKKYNKLKKIKVDPNIGPEN